MTKKYFNSSGVFSNNVGVLEYWSIGVMDERQISFFQHSNTPSLHYSYVMKPEKFMQLEVYRYLIEQI
jgi:hypothetical protein